MIRFFIAICLLVSLGVFAQDKQPKHDDRHVQHWSETLLNNQHFRMRKHAARSLGRLLDARGIEPLHKALSTDPNPEVRKQSAYALGKVGSRSSMRYLYQVSKRDDSPSVRRQALKSIERIKVRMDKQAKERAAQ